MNAMDLMKALGGLPEEDIIEELSYQPQHRRPAFLVSSSFLSGVSAAACLLLIVGVGFGVWSRQQKIETRPPQESTPVIATETSTETTASHTTGQQTETTIKVTATTELSVIVPKTTATQTTFTTTAQTASVYTTPTTAIQTSPATTAMQTIPTTAATVPTYPQHDTIPQYITHPSVTATETQPVQITEPVTVSQTENVPFTENTAMPQTAPVQLTGFRVEQYPDYQKVICTDDFPEPDGKLQSYMLISDELVLLAASEPVNAERTYEIEFPEAGKVFTVTQKEYSEFVLTVDEGELINIALNNVHGFFLLQDETCSLYWFRDGEGFYVQCDVDDLAYLMEIARSFTPAGEQK